MRVLAIIPARLQSTRLPRKLLLRESGKHLLQHVHEQVLKAEGIAKVVVATDSEEILEAARGFGADAVMTSVDHVSGTDRVAEAARLEEQAPDLVLNVQGDEPEIDPRHLQQLIDLMAGCDDPMGTLAEAIVDPADHGRPQVVKVVLNAAGQALYFSRAPIPSGATTEPSGVPALRHLGIYAYRPEFLQAFCELPPAPLEKSERLEQLRALYHGHALRVGVIEGSGARGIDTREDYDGFLARVRGAG